MKNNALLTFLICMYLLLSMGGCSPQSSPNESLILGTWQRIDRTRVDSYEPNGAFLDSILAKVDEVFETDTKRDTEKVTSNIRVKYVFEKDNVLKSSYSVQEPLQTGSYYIKGDSLRVHKLNYKIIELSDSLLVYEEEPTIFGPSFICTFKKVSE